MSGLPCHEPVECPRCETDVMPIVDSQGTAECPVCGTDVLADVQDDEHDATTHTPRGESA